MHWKGCFGLAFKPLSTLSFAPNGRSTGTSPIGHCLNADTSSQWLCLTVQFKTFFLKKNVGSADWIAVVTASVTICRRHHILFVTLGRFVCIGKVRSRFNAMLGDRVANHITRFLIQRKKKSDRKRAYDNVCETAELKQIFSLT